MHELQGILVVIVGFALVFVLSAVQLVAIHWLFSVLEFSSSESLDVLAKITVITISVFQVIWILNRVPVK